MSAFPEVTGRDFDRVLRLVTDGYDDDADDVLPLSLLTGLKELIPCDVLSSSELDVGQHVTCAVQELPGDDDVGPDDAPFWAHYWDALACSYPDRTGDTRSITKLSDFYTDQEFRASPMYCDYLGQTGMLREMMLCLRVGPGRTHRLLFWRGPGSDFTERDRALLILLRPHIVTAYRDGARRREMPQLTDRQWELLQLVAAGYTNAQIARRLSLSVGTVRKHLENIFERMSVSSRTAAVVKAFPSGEQVG
jgi:DNA-binding CsgD family transcriptional regulator